MIIKITAEPAEQVDSEVQYIGVQDVGVPNAGESKTILDALIETSPKLVIEKMPLAYMELPDALAVLIADHILAHAEGFTNDHDSFLLLTKLAGAIREAHGKIEGTL